MADYSHDFPEFDVSTALGLNRPWATLRKFGMNDTIPVGTSEMWPAGVLRTLPTSGAALSIVSDDAADVLTTGTGAWTIVIEGLDSNYEEITETVNMDGLTPVASVGTDWFRVNRAYNVAAGTNEINVGNITISIGGNVQAYIEANQGQTHQTHFTVPAGKTMIVVSYHIQVGRMGGNTDMHVLAQIKAFGTTAWRSISDIWLWDGARWSNERGAEPIPEKSELRQRIISTTTTQASSIFGALLVPNEYVNLL